MSAATFLEIKEGQLTPTVIFGTPGSAAEGHAFIAGDPLDNDAGWIHDIDTANHTDTRTPFRDEGPSGGAYYDGNVILCDTGNGLVSGAYDGGLGMGATVVTGLCFQAVPELGTSDLVVAGLGQSDVVEVVDMSNHFNVVQSCDSDGLASAMLLSIPDWVSVGGGTIATVGLLATPTSTQTQLESVSAATGVSTTISNPDAGAFTSTAVSPDGQTIYALYDNKHATDMSQQNQIQSYDVASGSLKQSAPLDGAAIGLALSPDGTTLVILQTNVTTGVPYLEPYTANNLGKIETDIANGVIKPLAVAFAPDGKTVLLVSKTQVVFYAVQQ